jgi:large subunit ribosomal protein L23
MALFSRKTKEDKKAKSAAPAVASESTASVATKANLAHVLRHARITEKASMHIEMGSYVFDVAENVSKREIAQAVKALYGVTPRMVRVATVPSKVKRNMRTGRIGVKQGGKKAYVYLKKGETINL